MSVKFEWDSNALNDAFKRESERKKNQQVKRDAINQNDIIGHKTKILFKLKSW